MSVLICVEALCEQVELPEFNVSFKPQKISPKFTSTVRNLLHKHIRDAYIHPTFINDVMKPMQVLSQPLHPPVPLVPGVFMTRFAAPWRSTSTSSAALESCPLSNCSAGNPTRAAFHVISKDRAAECCKLITNHSVHWTSVQVDVLLDQEVQHLSGGELQRVAITMCLGKPADIYLIDEPSAYLDSEQRIVAAKVATRKPRCLWSSNTSCA